MLGRLMAVASLVLALALIAAGCGDDDDETTTAATTTPTTTTAGATGATGATGEPLSHEEFVAQADAICEAGDEEIDSQAQEFFPEGGSPGTAEEEAFVSEVLVPNIQEQIDGIRALTPPEGDEDEVAAILDAAQDAIDQLEDDPSAITGAGSGPDPFAEANQLARDYGLKVCGQG
jgi:hypothetical protein